MAGEPDVLVVGGGIAGVTAARELAKRGQDVLIVEARDHLGGRTWAEKRLGTELELGGMSVHWLQGYVWAEIARYGLELASQPDLERATWLVNGKREDGSFEELCDLLEKPLSSFFATSRDVFPDPHDPYANLAALEEVDGETFSDGARRLTLNAVERGLLHAFWTLQFQGPPEEGALSQCLRWGALGGGEWRLLFEALAGYELANGTGELVQAMVDDGGFECQLSSPVEEIAEADGGVRISLAGGEELAAPFVVVAVPLNVLAEISFDPDLPPGLSAASRQRGVSRGLKVWAWLEGRIGPWCAMADQHPITWLATHHMEGERSLMMGLGPDIAALDPTDAGAVQLAVEQLLPGATVIESTGHDWVGDPYARGTWSMLRPGQLLALREREHLSGPVFVCGSDFASGWAGFIDGGIESGIVTARRVSEAARSDQASTTTQSI